MFRYKISDRFSRNIVRGSKRSDIECSVIPYETVAVAHTAVEPEFVAVQVIPKIVDKNFRVGCRYIPCAIVDHCFVLVYRFIGQGDKIAPQGDIGVFHIDTDTSRFERRAPRIIDPGIISED